MLTDPILLTKQSKLMKDYRENNEEIMHFFDYHPFINYESRVDDLKKRPFNRDQLTEALVVMNQEWGATKPTFTNIERLKKEDSVVVIGGQQAGLLTGPLYTINKIISIIQFAKQQETKLKIPVIPVFWIAGEDHDFEEMNHLYLPEKNQLKKYKIGQKDIGKRSISHISIDEKEAKVWLQRIFSQLVESEYTKDLYETFKKCLDHSNTYTDFFARVIFHLFAEEGLVLIDSAHPSIREIERAYFVQMIEKQQEISASINNTSELLKQKGYPLALDVKPNDANLFYHHNGERILLFRNAKQKWEGKQQEVALTTEEIMSIAKNNPELLSNNVVTRPLMQELLFPSLAFIGGPGEVSYWALLKPAFHALGINMPPVVPRLSLTYMGQGIDKLLKKYQLAADHTLNHGLITFIQEWIAAKSSPPIREITDDMKEQIKIAHEPLQKIAKELRADLHSLAETNLQYLYRDVDFIEKKLNKAIEEKYEKEIAELTRINLALNPEGGLQERMWSPLSLLNVYGKEFINKTMKQTYSFEEDHYLVYL